MEADLVTVHAPVNGSEAFNGGVPDTNFTVDISKDGGAARPLYAYFNKSDVAVERWNFTWFEDLFAADANTPSLVNVAAKAYRYVALYEPGNYTVTLRYYNGRTTVANWIVRPPSNQRVAKNVIMFIGDGMSMSMITAARLLSHQMVNGEFTSLMQLDKMDAIGHQMTHSIDSFITDSANSATALYTGKKSTVNALNVYVDSSPDPFDDPKFETIAELMYRVNGGKVGIVSTAYLADATPAALTARYGEIVDSFLYGEKNRNYTWTNWNGPDVLMGGGAENFIGAQSLNRQNYYNLFRQANYTVVHDKTALANASNSSRLLGVYCQSNLDKWVDRNVYPNNTKFNNNSALIDGTNADNQPGLKEMTLKAIDVLTTRSRANGSTNGYFLMMMHVLDYERALGELMELDDTVSATIEKLRQLGTLNETLIVVTADHAHGFDVFGSVDRQYLLQADGDRRKRRAVGVYQNSGLSGYVVANGSLPTNTTPVTSQWGPGFAVNWDPRYAIAAGFGANPDHREDYSTVKTGPRLPATAVNGSYYVNPADSPRGFTVNGTLPVDEAQGVHSLSDVGVYAMGPGSDTFRGVYSSIDIFFKMANALNLGRTSNVTTY
ncbi:hypothetical protein EMMF5_005466 [Cystobasidiomycetes sp. EMM_F5]